MHRSLAPLLFLATLGAVACSTTDAGAPLESDLLIYGQHSFDIPVIEAQIDLVRVEDFRELDLPDVAPIVFADNELTLLDVFDELHRRGLGVTSLV